MARRVSETKLVQFHMMSNVQASISIIQQSQFFILIYIYIYIIYYIYILSRAEDEIKAQSVS